MKTHAKLHIVIKGITTVDDALTAVEHGVPAIILSNHRGRALEHSPSPLEIVYEVRRNAPEVFSKVEVLADSGIRGGTDAIKLLALGVKAFGRCDITPTGKTSYHSQAHSPQWLEVAGHKLGVG